MGEERNLYITIIQFGEDKIENGVNFKELIEYVRGTLNNEYRQK